MSNRNKRRRAANKAAWIKIVAFGFIAIFLGGYVVDSFMTMNSMRSKSSNDEVTHINIPFSPQGVVTVREAQAGGGILYSGMEHCLPLHSVLCPISHWH